MKKNTFPTIVVILCLLILASLFAFYTYNKLDYSNPGNETIRVITEKERYARLEAEFACMILETDDAIESFGIMAEFPELVEEHNFTAERVDELQKEYREDEEFAEMALIEMNKTCSEILIRENLTTFTLNSPKLTNL